MTANRIVEYTIVTYNYVQELLEKGYQPFGSPFTKNNLDWQAIVKYEEEPSPIKIAQLEVKEKQ